MNITSDQNAADRNEQAAINRLRNRALLLAAINEAAQRAAANNRLEQALSLSR